MAITVERLRACLMITVGHASVEKPALGQVVREPALLWIEFSACGQIRVDLEATVRLICPANHSLKYFVRNTNKDTDKLTGP